MDNKKVVSFDLDGTLTDPSFVDSVWLKGIPSLYATKNSVSFEDAEKYVRTEYERIGRDRLEWYDLGYWIRKLKLDVSLEEFLRSYQHEIRVFPDVSEVLEEFKARRFRLIIVSNARREFLDMQLTKTAIDCYFERVFSATSDFGLVKKTPDLYEKVCAICAVSANEMIHVGDDWRFDFEVPTKIGIMSFHLDRTGETKGEYVVNSLKDFAEKLGADSAN